KNNNEILRLGIVNPLTGIAIVQNIFENATNDSNNQTLIGIGTTDTTNNNIEVNNVLFWHNTLVGQSSRMGYSNITGKSRRYWSVKNNVFDVYLNQTDNNLSNPSGVKTGNWTINFGVGAAGNIYANTSGAESKANSF